MGDRYNALRNFGFGTTGKKKSETTPLAVIQYPFSEEESSLVQINYKPPRPSGQALVLPLRLDILLVVQAGRIATRERISAWVTTRYLQLEVPAIWAEARINKIASLLRQAEADGLFAKMRSFSRLDPQEEMLEISSVLSME